MRLITYFWAAVLSLCAWYVISQASIMLMDIASKIQGIGR